MFTLKTELKTATTISHFRDLTSTERSCLIDGAFNAWEQGVMYSSSWTKGPSKIHTLPSLENKYTVKIGYFLNLHSLPVTSSWLSLMPVSPWNSQLKTFFLRLAPFLSLTKKWDKQVLLFIFKSLPSGTTYQMTFLEQDQPAKLVQSLARIVCF